MGKDELGQAIGALGAGEMPLPRLNLSEPEKDKVIQALGGVRTTKDVLKALKSYPPRRIPFLFSSLDTQAVVDALNNDMLAAVRRAEAALPPKKSKKLKG